MRVRVWTESAPRGERRPQERGKPEEPAKTTAWSWKLLFLLLGPVALAVAYFLVVELGVSPRFVIAGAAATGLLGYKVIPRP